MSQTQRVRVSFTDLEKAKSEYESMLERLVSQNSFTKKHVRAEVKEAKKFMKFVFSRVEYNCLKKLD